MIYVRMYRARSSNRCKNKFERTYCPKAAPATTPEREALIHQLTPEALVALARETFGREPSASDLSFVRSAVCFLLLHIYLRIMLLNYVANLCIDGFS